MQRWGSKVLAVLKGGQLNLHGKARSASWTRLESNAVAGTRGIKLPAGAAMGWPVGEELMISTSSHDLHQTEVATLSAASSSGDVELAETLSYDHNGELYSFAGVDGDGYDGRAIVASLTRNVRIYGIGDAQDSWGCSMIIQGRAYVERVELRYCGKRGASGTGTVFPAVLVDGRGPGTISGYFRDSVVRQSYSDALATRGRVNFRNSLEFEVTGNLVFSALGGTGYSVLNTNLRDQKEYPAMAPMAQLFHHAVSELAASDEYGHGPVHSLQSRQVHVFSPATLCHPFHTASRQDEHRQLRVFCR